MAACELATSVDLENFLHCALVAWLESFLPKPELISDYTSLLDGTIIHSVWQKIDPGAARTLSSPVGIEGLDLAMERTKNFEAIVRNIQDYYENKLQQIVLALPDCFNIGSRPDSKTALDSMKQLLVLILGAAVQCPKKETFISKIKELDTTTQHDIVDLIKKITDSNDLVVSADSLQSLSKENLFKCFKIILKDRNHYFLKPMSHMKTSDVDTIDLLPSAAGFGTAAPAHIAKEREISDMKSKMRQLHEELVEKSEALIEMKIELDHTTNKLQKLNSESQQWYAEAKQAKAYRDELDAIREKADKLEGVQSDVQKLREKLAAAEFFKTRVEELREDNRVLFEAKTTLEEQLARARERCQQVSELEAQLSICNRKLHDLSVERSQDRMKFDELLAENAHLQLTARSQSYKPDLNASDSSDFFTSQVDLSLSEQLKNSTQSKLLALEQENRQLLAQIEELKQISVSGAASSEILLACEELNKQVQENENMQSVLAGKNQELTEMERHFLERSLEEAQNRLKELSAQNQQQAEKNAKLQAKLDSLSRAGPGVSDLKKQLGVFASQQMANETIIQNLRKNLRQKTQFVEIIKINLDKLGLDATRIENPDFEKVLQCGQLFSSPGKCNILLNHARRFTGNFEYSSAAGASGPTEADTDSGGNVRNLIAKLNSLQVTNSQLTDSKEQLLDQIESLKQRQKVMMRDQNRLIRQHDRLGAEYEAVVKDRDLLKRLILNLKEENLDLESRVAKSQKSNIDILQAEHSKLSEDFCELYTTCHHYKTSYESLKTEYEGVKHENDCFREQISELGRKIEAIVTAESGYNSLAERCEMLLTMNTSLTHERTSLMKNVSNLLKLYQELFAHSLEDKQQYRQTEQNYANQINTLNRQKERLEIKIMEQYKMTDTGAKKKETSLIKRMRKVSSDLMNRVPRSRKSWTDESSSTPTRLQQDPESVSLPSEAPSEFALNSPAELDVQSLQTLSIDADELERNEPFEFTESSDEPPDHRTLFEPGSRKPIYRIPEGSD